MKQLEINGIKNKTNDISFMSLSKADRDYIANFMYDHKEEFKKKHFKIFCNSEFLHEVREYNVDLFIKMLLDVSEYYTIDFLNALLDFSPFTKHYYTCLRDMYIPKVEIEEGYLKELRIIDTEIEILICTPVSYGDLATFCEHIEYTKINQIIINTKGNFLKYESIGKIKALLKKNESTVREIKIK